MSVRILRSKLMTLGMPRLIAGRTLLLASTASFLGLATLAFTSTDAMIDRSFQQAFAIAGDATVPVPAVAAAQAPNPLNGSEGFWLSRHEQPNVNLPGQGAIKVGDRITMAVEAGRPAHLEVVSIAEPPVGFSTVNTASSPRLVIVTCREISNGHKAGKTIRFIVEGDELPAHLTADAPARTL